MRAPSFWYGDSAGASTLGALLTPLSALYRLGAKIKNANTRPYSAHAKVVCVGNLTLGGTGKTPVAIALAERLNKRGLKTIFLSRGYGGRLQGPLVVRRDEHRADDVGDEPLLLARTSTTIVACDRAAGARMADEMGADIIVMDDGHQNSSLRKDLSLVVIDAEAGFGNGHVFPAGPLREPVGEGLARADAVILIGDGSPDYGTFSGPVLHAHLAPAETAALGGTKIVAFAGIGRPEKFLAMLDAMGAELCASRCFEDHHPYTAAELTELRVLAAKFEARLVTTEKDYVRIEPGERVGIVPIAVRTLFSDEAALVSLLDKLTGTLAKRTP